MCKSIQNAFFDEEKLKLLIELIINLVELSIEEGYSFCWDDIVVHQNWRDSLDYFQYLFRMKKNLNNFLFCNFSEEVLVFRLVFVTEQGDRGVLIKEI